jgi:signal transduction histidine kinase/CheY-like chemotaxis protein
MSHSGEKLLTVAACAIYVFLGFYCTLLYSMRKADLHNLLYGIFSGLAAVYFYVSSPGAYDMIKDTAITQRIEFAMSYLLVFVLTAFLENFNVGRVRPLTVIYGLICVVLIVLQCLTSIWFAADLYSCWRFIGVIYLLYVTGRDIVYPFSKRVRDRYEAKGEGAAAFLPLLFWSLRDEESGSILLLLAILLCTGVFDLLNSNSNVPYAEISLTPYGFFAFMLCLSFILARKSADRFEATEQIVRQRTRELEEQVLVAKSASRAKSDFLANMSHEIRTPLNAIIGMAKIGVQTEEWERKEYAFAKIEEASEHLLGIINDILDMSKIEAGKLELNEIVFRIDEVVARVENVIRFRTMEKKQEFAVFLAEDLPEAVRGDDLRLAQVLTNLIGNAVKFTPEKGRITLSAFFDGEANGRCLLRFLVKDTGIGITQEQKAKLFNVFQQAKSSTTRKYGGTGLGLALSKQIVELMGGSIWVDSAPGQGSTFGFTIKAPRTEWIPEKKTDTAETMRTGEFTGNIILLAEDVQINREIIITLLEPTGALIESAENGLQAAEMFERAPERYDLILMDLQMPILDGYGATRRIRAGQSSWAGAVPIVAMTANVFRDDIERSLASGMNAHLGKPIELDKVLLVLRRYLNQER